MESLDAILKNRGLLSLDEYESMITNRSFISTGHPELDELISDGNGGLGGIPRGCITEVFGATSVGKSRFCKDICARDDVRSLYIDAENSLSAAEFLWLKERGVSVISESCIETLWGLLNDIIASNELDLIVIDSLAALVTNTELAADNEPTMATQMSPSKALTAWMKQLVRSLNGTETAVVFVNHKKFTPGMFSTATTPGGVAPKFYSSLRLDFSAKKQDLKGSVQKVEVSLAKSRFSPKNTSCKFKLELDFNNI